MLQELGDRVKLRLIEILRIALDVFEVPKLTLVNESDGMPSDFFYPFSHKISADSIFLKNLDKALALLESRGVSQEMIEQRVLDGDLLFEFRAEYLEEQEALEGWMSSLLPPTA